jgi:hypothetical protein
VRSQKTKEAQHDRYMTSIDLQQGSISVKWTPVQAAEVCKNFTISETMEILGFHYFSRAGLLIAIKSGTTPKTFS